MERRGEGFERERVTPEPGREVRREGVERERITEPMMTREERYGVMEPGLRARDLTHWSAVWAGFFVALSVSVLVGLLGVALGLTSGTNAAMWASVSLIVGFFCGGWFAARTSSVGGPNLGLIHGGAVWAVTTAVLLVLGAFGLAGALGVTGMMPGMMAPGAPGNVGAAQLAGWGAFIALVLGLIASLSGGYVGGTAYEQVPPRITR